MMQQMMQMIGHEPSLLGRMPGFKNMADLRRGLAAQVPATCALFGGMNPFGASGNKPTRAASRLLRDDESRCRRRRRVRAAKDKRPSARPRRPRARRRRK